MERVTQLLRDLVALPSVNPALAGEGAGEAAVAAYVASFCARLGLAVHQQEVFPGRPNVVARLEAPRSRGTLLFEAHTDTVPAGEMRDAFAPTIGDGRLYGRGACDTKGSLAAMLAALERLATSDSPPPCDVVLLAAASEEDGSLGAEAFLDMQLPVDGAIVGEPTSLSIVVAHKGVARFRLLAEGVAGHTAHPKPEENALYQAVEVVAALRDYAEQVVAARRHPLVGPGTLTVTRLHGGEVLNITPARCTIDIDRRTVPGEAPEAAIADVEALVARLSEARPWLRVRRDTIFQLAAGMETAATHPLVGALSAACDARSLDTTLRGVAYGTDASALAGKGGIPCVVFGPGSIAQAHTANEWVSLADVAAAAAVLEAAARRFMPQR